MDRTSTMICELLGLILDRLEVDPGVKLSFKDLKSELHQAVTQLVDEKRIDAEGRSQPS